MRNIVGDLFQPLVQFQNAYQHDIEIARQPVEFVARAVDGKPAGQIAIHDALRCARHIVDAFERAPPHEEPDQKRTHAHDAKRQHQRVAYQIAKSLRFAQIPPDEQPHSIRQGNHHGNGAMLHLRRLFAVTAIGKGTFDNTVRVEHARFNAFHITGKNTARRVGDKIEIGTRLARAIINGSHKLQNTAARIAFADARDFLAQRLLGLPGQNGSRKVGHVKDKCNRAHCKEQEIKRGKPRRGGAHECGKPAHHSALAAADCLPRPAFSI